ncbi:MAG TPA: efflux RND transporter periplasmic adaptor subunit [Bryobacteraceae bacterium]|nr:efflux RND transporter periplasmic adaptor subunit [Bryobacteraceae bacterium]
MVRKIQIILLCSAVLVLTACSEKKAQGPTGAPRFPVTIATASSESVPVEIRVVGTVEPSSTVQIKSQVAGELTQVHFTEGQNAEKGQLLFEIDSRPYQEALRQAEANVLRDQAQLKQAEATRLKDIASLKNSQADADRYGALQKEGVVSRQQADAARTSADVLKETIRADEAAIESAKAAVNADVAAVAAAKLNLSYCRITSPVSGRTGNLLVHPGNLVKVNDVALVVINRVSPVFVSFNAPENQLTQVRQRFGSGARLDVDVTPQDATGGAPSRGALTVVDNTVDTSTGTIKLKATLPNDDRRLWPGQFVNVVLTLNTQKDATVIPSEAVQAGQQGTYVYVVKPDQTVEARMVKVGQNLERKVVIDQGLAAGERVVTDGQLLLRPGAMVFEVPAQQQQKTGA